jgi:hypothetical protein
MPRPKVTAVSEALQELFPKGSNTTWKEFGFPYRYLSGADATNVRDVLGMYILLVAPGNVEDVRAPLSMFRGDPVLVPSPVGLREGKEEEAKTAMVQDFVTVSTTTGVNYAVPNLKAQPLFDRITLSDALTDGKFLRKRVGARQLFWRYANLLDLATLEIIPVGIAMLRDWLHMVRGEPPQTYAGFSWDQMLEKLDEDPEGNPFRKIERAIKPFTPGIPEAPPPGSFPRSLPIARPSALSEEAKKGEEEEVEIIEGEESVVL